MNGPVIDSLPGPPSEPPVCDAFAAVATAPLATSTVPVIVAPSSSFAPLPSVWVLPASSTVPSAPAEP